jgi:hypothetical protein
MRSLTPVPALRGVLLSTLLILGCGAAAAEDVALNPSRPQTYVVRPGDTLWDIAGRFLTNPWDWRKVWHANPGVANPNLIFPGDTLRLVEGRGGARVHVERGKRVVKLSPRVRVEELEAPVPTIPLNVIAPFLSQPYVAQTDDIQRAPYVVGFPDDRSIVGMGDSFYARGIRDTGTDNFAVVRTGSPYTDPDTKEVLGYEAAFVANARVVRPGDPTKLVTTRSAKEVAEGDRLVPASTEEVLANFYPVPAPAGLTARIIAVLNGVTQIGQYNIVVLNRGSRNGIKEGQVFHVYSGGDEHFDRIRARDDEWDRDWPSESPLTQEFWYGRARQDGWIEGQPSPNAPLPLHADVRKRSGAYVTPFEESGTVMVFRVFDRVSFALVMRATRAMHVLDTLAAPGS